MVLDEGLQAGHQVGISGLDSLTDPTGWWGVAAASQAHERTGLTPAQPHSWASVIQNYAALLQSGNWTYV